MKRALFGLFAWVTAVLVTSPLAFTHGGGQWRDPKGQAPPDLRDPFDPTPPPPPPPPPAQPPTPGNPPPPGNATPPAPVTPGPPPCRVPPRPVTGLPFVPGGSGCEKTSYDQWVFWWNYNNDDTRHVKESIDPLRISGGGMLAAVGGSTGARDDATRVSEAQIKKTLIPALLWAMDRANQQFYDVQSAAYIALAKVTGEPAHIALLEAGVQDANGKKNSDVDPIVNESAALSLGLLRRQDKARQFDAKELDQVRDFCLDVYANDTLEVRTRCFAMLSLGLLGDQPTAFGVPPAAGTPTTPTGTPPSNR